MSRHTLRVARMPPSLALDIPDGIINLSRIWPVPDYEDVEIEMESSTGIIRVLSNDPGLRRAALAHIRNRGSADLVLELQGQDITEDGHYWYWKGSQPPTVVRVWRDRYGRSPDTLMFMLPGDEYEWRRVAVDEGRFIGPIAPPWSVGRGGAPDQHAG